MRAAAIETNPADFDDFPGLLALLEQAFAAMAGRIDPPSSLDGMTQADLRAKTTAGDLFLLRDGQRPVACLFGAPRGDVYYLDKLAVADAHRGAGIARALIAAAAAQAHRRGCGALELRTRVELVENHRRFEALGFRRVGASRHPGFDRPTSLTFRRPLPAPAGLSPAAPLA